MAYLLVAALLLITHVTADLVVTNYVAYEAGTLPLIISSPHGGSSKPTSFPVRRDGCYINDACVWDYICSPQNSDKCDAKTAKDSYTREIAEAVAQFISEDATDPGKPYQVISQLHRSRLDPNREVNQATLGNNDAIDVYNEYHGKIESSINAINGTALVVDFHGQSHSEQWVELGYAVSRTKLNSGTLPSGGSSLKRLMELNCGTDSICSYTFINGNKSLGNFLDDESNDYDVVPSPSIPSPGNGNYYSGGYITKTYGAFPDTDAIQVEIPNAIRFNKNGLDRNDFARDLASSLLAFLNANGYINQ